MAQSFGQIMYEKNTYAQQYLPTYVWKEHLCTTIPTYLFMKRTPMYNNTYLPIYEKNTYVQLYLLTYASFAAIIKTGAKIIHPSFIFYLQRTDTVKSS